MSLSDHQHSSDGLSAYRGRVGLDLMDALVNDTRLRPLLVEGRCYLSLVNLMEVFGDLENTSYDGRTFWRDEKKRLQKRKPELCKNFSQLKLRARDGKMRQTDVAPLETCFRILFYMTTPSSDLFKDLAAGVLARYTEAEMRYRAFNIARGLEHHADAIHEQMADDDPPDYESPYADMGYIDRKADRYAAPDSDRDRWSRNER
jgi:hypothetical protein